MVTKLAPSWRKADSLVTLPLMSGEPAEQKGTAQQLRAYRAKCVRATPCQMRTNEETRVDAVAFRKLQLRTPKPQIKLGSFETVRDLSRLFLGYHLLHMP